ncbi:MAG: hypothetical protein FWD02_01445 [Bacteroidales bacterium]|nr:hypothetical protein [Bacteroidales bacterium]
MKKILSIFVLFGLLLSSCNVSSDERPSISERTIQQVISELSALHPNQTERIEIGVRQAASLWFSRDGGDADFKEFTLNNFVACPHELDLLFERLQRNFEILTGNLHKINVRLMMPLHIYMGDIMPVDRLFGGFSPFSHLNEDMFDNKIAFVVLLNFRTFSLEEKNRYGANWTRTQWAHARMGERFTSRVPSELRQEFSRVFTQVDTWRTDYNFYMGQLLTNDGRRLFPEDLRLITHWGLRDHLRTYYALEGRTESQEMIFKVMNHVINQTVPEVVINNPNVQWNPFENTVYENGVRITSRPEQYRYQMLLDLFRMHQRMDPYTPQYENYIEANFSGSVELSKQIVRDLFVQLVSSDVAREVGQVMSQRLGRDLRPFDLWYNGFRARGAFPEAELNALTRRLYPNAMAFERDMPNMLMTLGWDRRRATEIASGITVDASRGIGHAWGAQMMGDQARLRTRIPVDGMDFRGFNIGIHELGHNVEQVISLYDVDYWMLRSVPNTAFTEALAFIFQDRDMELLGKRNDNPLANDLATLGIFWNTFEIMGVSLVDMGVWEWMYANPNANANQLRDAVIRIAKDVWNEFFAPVFGIEDQPILAIYTHMIMRPLYLSNYPLGRLIQFQLEEYMAGRNFAAEVDRMFALGNLTPKHWMLQAVGEELSVQPLIEATERSVRRIRQDD